MKKNLFICLALISVLTISSKEYNAAVPEISSKESFVNLFNAIGEATGNKFNIQIVPPARVIYLIENKLVDATFPAIVSNNSKIASMLKYDYSTVKAYKMAFVLYTNKNKSIDVAELKKGNPKNYKIETTGSLAQLFEFQLLQTTNLDASLKKVDNGSIDGLLYAQEVGDQLLKNLGLKNIIRKSYGLSDNAFGIQKGSIGSEIDKVLTDGVAKLKANGKLNQILASPMKNSSYIEWQP